MRAVTKTSLAGLVLSVLIVASAVAAPALAVSQDDEIEIPILYIWIP